MPEEIPKIKKIKKTAFTALWRYAVTSLSLKIASPGLYGGSILLQHLEEVARAAT